MEGTTLAYRGSLKSCNYHCSYCPFSKQLMTKRELEKDREQWISFVRSFMEGAGKFDIRALMLVPYGEALIHPWYWEGLARLSAQSDLDVVGAQTNLSFPIPKSLAHFEECGGKTEKLRLWATFHPEMITVSEFADACRQLRYAGITLCVGAVGAPKNIELLLRLKKELPEEIYVWINKMDGLGRPYTLEEKEVFLKIDPYFERELVGVPSDKSMCRKRLFAEADGRMRTCNIAPVLGTDWQSLFAGQSNFAVQSNFALQSHFALQKNGSRKSAAFPEPVCGRKRCFCYLAYGGRDDFMNQVLFGPYPLFRIPRRPGAVFLDIMGTLIPKAAGDDTKINLSVLTGLNALARDNIPLFFATTLPYQEAMKRCRRIRHLFRGGIFAGGAHILWTESDGKREIFLFLDKAYINSLEILSKKYKYRIITYQHNNNIYKITLLRPSHKSWDHMEAKELFGTLPDSAKEGLRYFIEENCLQIVCREATKANGVRTMCEWIGISMREAYAYGDSEEDREMMESLL